MQKNNFFRRSKTFFYYVWSNHFDKNVYFVILSKKVANYFRGIFFIPFVVFGNDFFSFYTATKKEAKECRLIGDGILTVHMAKWLFNCLNLLLKCYKNRMNKEEYLEQISKESGVPKDEITGVYTDEEKGERLIFKRNQLINQLTKIEEQIKESFDKIYTDEFYNLSSDLSEILPLLYIGHKHSLEENNKLLITCGDLLRNASNTIISSVSSLRSGFRLQSGILQRSVIEMCATVIHLIVEPNALDDFQNDKLKSTYSISVANKQISIFGKIWGLLSNKQIHINSLHADWYPLNTFESKEEIPAEVTIGIIGMSIVILRITTELAFCNYIDELQYWKRIDENKLAFIPPNEDNIKWIKEKLDKE